MLGRFFKLVCFSGELQLEFEFQDHTTLLKACQTIHKEQYLVCSFPQLLALGRIKKWDDNEAESISEYLRNTMIELTKHFHGKFALCFPEPTGII